MFCLDSLKAPGREHSYGISESGVAEEPDKSLSSAPEHLTDVCGPGVLGRTGPLASGVGRKCRC